MSDVEKSEAIEVNTDVSPKAEQAPGRLSAEVEIKLLKDVHAFLTEYNVPIKQATVWLQIVDRIGLVTNSLIGKQDDAVKAALAEKKAE